MTGPAPVCSTAAVPAHYPDAIRDLIDARLDALAHAARERGVALPERGLLARVALISDVALERLGTDPELLAQWPALLASTQSAAARWPDCGADGLDDDAMMARLRRFRQRESVRLIARDALGLASIDTTLTETSALAETCLERALAAVEQSFEQRFGRPRSADGSHQRLVVIGMGKLGGDELNFSSDIDLIFAFGEPGSCDGPRALDNEDFFARLGRRLIQLLAEVTADGMAYRIDMRLRPFGSAGRLALGLAAMEHYYQRDGRDWERYAWIKARPVAGDRACGARLIEALRPFVYRRYLDFTAIEGLREMKALIDAEVARKELERHVKLGRGGIRELEFMLQLVQMVRGGREPSLRASGFFAALAAAVEAGHVPRERGAVLAEAYRFLRRLENRLQMLRDEQTHTLPEDELTRLRLALGLGFPDIDAFEARLKRERDQVASAFAETLAPGEARPAPAPRADFSAWWQAADASHAAPAPFDAGAGEALAALARLTKSRIADARARARLDRLVPDLIERAAARAEPGPALERVLRLLHAVLGRATYLALLDERPQARARLLDVFARSAWLAERVSAHPLLLDDLLDARVAGALPDSAGVAASIESGFTALAPEDLEARLGHLAEVRHSALFRLALGWLARREDAVTTAARAAAVAEAVVDAVVRLAAHEVSTRHGALLAGVPWLGFAVLGYGSLGGAELGFGSDLDLVFVFDGAHADRVSAGPRALDAGRWYAQVAQRVVHWLTTPMRGGSLYEIDTRLRPDGGKGLLVTPLAAFADYQDTRAWTWEHQALVRARAVAGDSTLGAALAALRTRVLARPRDRATLLTEVARMRERWRKELDRSDSTRIDLKQGRGALVDLEFLLQAEVLALGAAADRAWPTRTPELLQALAETGCFGSAEAEALRAAHSQLLTRALDCSVDGAPRVVARDAAIERALASISAASSAHGFTTSE